MFILIDYIMFRFSLGKYSARELRKRHPINLSWESAYEPALEDLLVEGDIVFFSHKHFSLSWIVRYLTKTDISHVGFYKGNGEILHSTLSGTRIDKLQHFFENDYCVIPVSMQALLSKNADLNLVNFNTFIGRKYPLKSTMLRAMLFFVGWPWRKFRVTYLFDVLLALTLLSLVISRERFLTLIIYLYGAYLVAILFAFLSRNKAIVPIFDPGEGFYSLPKEANVIPCIKKMNEPWFIDMIQKGVRNGSKL